MLLDQDAVTHKSGDSDLSYHLRAFAAYYFADDGKLPKAHGHAFPYVPEAASNDLRKALKDLNLIQSMDAQEDPQELLVKLFEKYEPICEPHTARATDQKTMEECAKRTPKIRPALGGHDPEACLKVWTGDTSRPDDADTCQYRPADNRLLSMLSTTTTERIIEKAVFDPTNLRDRGGSIGFFVSNAGRKTASALREIPEEPLTLRTAPEIMRSPFVILRLNEIDNYVKKSDRETGLSFQDLIGELLGSRRDDDEKGWNGAGAGRMVHAVQRGEQVQTCDAEADGIRGELVKWKSYVSDACANPHAEERKEIIFYINRDVRLLERYPLLRVGPIRAERDVTHSDRLVFHLDGVRVVVKILPLSEGAKTFELKVFSVENNAVDRREGVDLQREDVIIAIGDGAVDPSPVAIPATIWDIAEKAALQLLVEDPDELECRGMRSCFLAASDAFLKVLAKDFVQWNDARTKFWHRLQTYLTHHINTWAQNVAFAILRPKPRKIDIPIVLPENGEIKHNGFVWELTAVVEQHSGLSSEFDRRKSRHFSPSSHGHYIAARRHGTSWYKFDDTQAEEIDAHTAYQ